MYSKITGQEEELSREQVFKSSPKVVDDRNHAQSPLQADIINFHRKYSTPQRRTDHTSTTSPILPVVERNDAFLYRSSPSPDLLQTIKSPSPNPSITRPKSSTPIKKKHYSSPPSSTPSIRRPTSSTTKLGQKSPPKSSAKSSSHSPQLQTSPQIPKPIELRLLNLEKTIQTLSSTLLTQESRFYLPHIIRIQSVARGYIVRKTARALKLFSWYKSHFKCSSLKINTWDEILYDCSLIGGGVCGVRLKKGVRLLGIIRFQSLVRGWFVRKRIRQYKEDVARVVKIQSLWRGRKVRKLFEFPLRLHKLEGQVRIYQRLVHALSKEVRTVKGDLLRANNRRSWRVRFTRKASSKNKDSVNKQ